MNIKTTDKIHKVIFKLSIVVNRLLRVIGFKKRFHISFLFAVDGYKKGVFTKIDWY